MNNLTIKFTDDDFIKHLLEYMSDCDVTVTFIDTEDRNYTKCYHCGSMCDIDETGCWCCGKDFVGIVKEES